MFYQGLSFILLAVLLELETSNFFVRFSKCSGGMSSLFVNSLSCARFYPPSANNITSIAYKNLYRPYVVFELAGFMFDLCIFAPFLSKDSAEKYNVSFPLIFFEAAYFVILIRYLGTIFAIFHETPLSLPLNFHLICDSTKV
jgi:hypothetical protein